MKTGLEGSDGAVCQPYGNRCLRSQKATFAKPFQGNVDCVLLEIIGQ
jgi:hypothetical protein